MTASGATADTPPPERVSDPVGASRRLIRALGREGRLVWIVLALGTGSVGLTLFGPLLLGRATDLVFAGVVGAGLPVGVTKEQAVVELRERGENRQADMLAGMEVIPGQGIDYAGVAELLLLAAVLFVLSFGLAVAQGRLVAHVVQRTGFWLREQAQGKLARLPLRYFDDNPRGDILSRTTNDIDNITQTLQQTMGQFLTSLLTIIGVLAMMLWISPLLACVALVTVPVSVLLTGAVAKRAQPHFGRQWAATGGLNAHIEEMYTGHALIKAFGRQDQAAETFEEHNQTLTRSSFRAQFIAGVIQPMMMFVSNLNFVLVVVIGALRVATGTMSIGGVQAFIQYSNRFNQPITQVAAMVSLVQSGLASAERLFELLDADEQEPDPAVPLPAPPRQRGARVVFEHVRFRYRPDVPLIDDLSLTVEPGRSVAIVGPTGAGKTTLVNLLMRFYELTSGRITLDGADIAQLSRDELRGRIGMVLQDTWLFGGTVADNIAYGVGDVPRERVIAAARATNADRFIRTLPDGYDTVLDDEASNLSAGGKQLITIARAFLIEPAILVLDEATSAVDTRTEMLLQEAMGKLRAGRTSFVIAHRLSTIRNADLILVMESGRIVQQGNHDHLLALDGAYARLYAAQFAQAVQPQR